MKGQTDGSFTQSVGVLIEDPGCRCCLGVAHAVGVELGLLPADLSWYESLKDKGDENLPNEIATCLGIEDQRAFSQANDFLALKKGVITLKRC